MENSKPNNWLSEKYLIYASTIAILLLFMPYFLLGENIHIRMNDNLDANIVWVKMALNSSLSPSATVDQIMGGIPLYSIWGTYDISILFTYLFGSFWAYVFCKLIMAFSGFWGMYLLLKKYCLPKDTPYYIIAISSLFFSMLPFWSFHATVSAAPLVIYAFLNLRNKETDWYNWAILIFYAFDSSIVLLGIFILLFFSFLLVWDFVKSKKINWILFSGLLLLSVGYIISHLPLFYAFFGSTDFVSVRESFKTTTGFSLKGALNEFVRYTLFSDEHLWSFVPAKQFPFLLLAIFSAILLSLKKRRYNKLFISLLSIIFVTSAFCSIWDTSPFTSLRETAMQIIPLDLKRVHWIQPVCWYILFAISLYVINKHIKKGYLIVSVIAILQFGILLKSQEYITYHYLPTYRQFYAEKQFNDIKEHINKDISEYRVINIGLHPAIAQYNGFYTLDGYSVNYPLEYKYKFKKIIEKELDKNLRNSAGFDRWGGWCYIFWQDFYLWYFQTCKNDYSTINELALNYDILKEMGGEYIISAVEINTKENERLQLVKTFDNYPDSHWTIHLYKIL